MNLPIGFTAGSCAAKNSIGLKWVVWAQRSLSRDLWGVIDGLSAPSVDPQELFSSRTNRTKGKLSCNLLLKQLEPHNH